MKKISSLFRTKSQLFCVLFLMVFSVILISPVPARAISFSATEKPKNNAVFVDKTKNYCGSNPKVYTTINLGCAKKGNPIIDLLFAIIKFLVVGATLVITGSLVIAGIQYITAGGSPDAVGKAKKRIFSSLTALFILIFGWAILNYLIPITILK